MITDYQWINDNSELDELILSINTADEIAFDSEFERINTFYPKPALFQLKVKDKYYLIDMKQISNHAGLGKLLDNIVLHAGSEDLEILLNLNNELPSKIFDTQIAASLCGYGLHFSYQNIVNELIGIELSKAHSRSDWMQRPLSPEQIQYALDDVVYLPEIKDILMENLQQQGRVEWYELLIKQKTQALLNSDHVNKTFLKLAKSKRLNEEQQKLLFALLTWREKQAIKRNKPRPWIIKNPEILSIVLKRPTTDKQLMDDVGLYRGFVKYNAQALFDLYTSCESLDFANLPKFNSLSPKQGNRLAEVKQILVDKCEKINLPAALVINTADLKSLVASGKELSSLAMWNLINN